MLYFLYGPDTYRSRQKLNEIVERYKNIHKSGLNFSTLDDHELDFDEFKNRAQAVSMFQEKKLIVLKRPFSNKNFLQKFEEYLSKSRLTQDKDVIVVVWEEEIDDSRASAPKLLKKIARSQEFKLLDNQGLRRWLWQEAAKRGLKLNVQAAEKLLLHTGSDLWRLANELGKLASFKPNRQITVEDIDALVEPMIHADIFKTIDAIAEKNKKLALKLISKHLSLGEDELYILAMIEYQFRNLLKVADRTDRTNKTDRVDHLAKELGMHPFVVKKSLEQAKKFSIDELKKIYEKLFDLDLQIKTGKIEPRLGLELFVASI